MTHLPSPAGWNAAIAANDTADTPLDVLAADLIARLATVPDITDMPTCRNEAARLVAKTRFYATLPDTGRGMLGANGIGPAVDACIRRAATFGFHWRSDEFLGARPAVVERMLIEGAL